ncbi:Hypothetical predicted protein [Marmota monax]|uniref:GDP-mannose 4,6-dehydratase n=1 Tax=Marmota monax TaxID=9995 RepID=A0A5E4BSG7_MARMO|nr:Hypothetical predicted protein [Marmota monax]
MGKFRKVALITGITGQDGSYLAEFLLEKGYEVHGIVRRSSSFNTGRIEHLYKNPQAHIEGNMKLHYGDLTDSTCLVKIINEVKPTEIYNLGAQSHVKMPPHFQQPLPPISHLLRPNTMSSIEICVQMERYLKLM